MDESPVVKIARLRPEADSDIPLPHYMTPGAAGMDIAAAVATSVTIGAGEIALVPTGFAIELPVGLEAQIRPRSGLAVKYGIGIPNSPGTIDADYRGEVKVALINFSPVDYTIHRGERIAQMIISPVCRAELQPVEALSESSRGGGGFGHTGR
jgi:dUTP pyrophosphatase